jgi:uncharacterized membrane protein YeaQ/YmgE (transglycosylase-associated protein family)
MRASYFLLTKGKKETDMLNMIVWLVVGGLIGWVASMIMGTNARQGALMNIVVGVIGAFLGGVLLAPMFGTGTINQGDFSIMSMLVSLIGAVVLLAVVNLIRRGRGRGRGARAGLAR